MTDHSVSVIVVSRGRAQALMRCLTGIEQLYHPNFEIVVVADPTGMSAVAQSRFKGRIKAIGFDAPNISAARNVGLAAAGGKIVAFIDDDAVPEPTWLDHLTRVFDRSDVAAAGGYVRGRNGISFQNRARSIDRHGDHTGISMVGDAPRIFEADPNRAIKTEGTNCAFRRDILAKIGGFDPAFAFFMDETDLNLRLALLGHKTAIVPLAQVHHGFAASDRRHANRMPRSLFDIGASQMVLLRKHASGSDFQPVLERLRTEQRARLVRHMVAGTCEPSDIARLMATLEAGIADGASREFGKMDNIGPAPDGFQKFERVPPFHGSTSLAGRIWQSKRLREEAAGLVAGGTRVSLFLFSPSAFYHRVAFTPQGVWEQCGGLWGRSVRSGPLITVKSFADRTRLEVARIAPQRNLTY